jgi:hypothetical protein
VKIDTYKTPKYYNEGPRKLNILHTRRRHQCSSLNADLSKIHIINNFNNVGEFLIDMSRLFQSETVDGINELADVLSLHLSGT